MAWSVPRTWVTSELVTASLMNTHLRDNLNYLHDGGPRTIWIPAPAMTPATTNGCGLLTTVEQTAQQVELHVLPFDTSADEHAIFEFAMPKSWNESTITFKPYWLAAGTSTNGVAWALQARALGDSDASDAAYGTAVVVTDDDLGAAYDLCIGAESAAVTIAGTPAEFDLVSFDIFRDVSDANDDLAEDALLWGVHIYYTTNQIWDD